MTTFRYKFSDEFLTKLDLFTRQHYMEESDLFKLSWESWKIYNKETVEKETMRLKSLGYNGDIEKKMFKSTRYYYKNRVNIEPSRKSKRRNYIELNKKFLNLIDKDIKGIKDIEKIKPKNLYNDFINNNVYKSYIESERKRLFKEGLDNIEITKKMKKTYKNKLYCYKNNKNK